MKPKQNYIFIPNIKQIWLLLRNLWNLETLWALWWYTLEICMSIVQFKCVCFWVTLLFQDSLYKDEIMTMKSNLHVFSRRSTVDEFNEHQQLNQTIFELERLKTYFMITFYETKFVISPSSVYWTC